MTTAAKPCLCGSNVQDSNGVMHCKVCNVDYHPECVGLKFLVTALDLVPQGSEIFKTPDWTCPSCIYTAQLLTPGNALLNAIAEKVAQMIGSTPNPVQATSYPIESSPTMATTKQPVLEPIDVADATIIPAEPAWTAVVGQDTVQEAPQPKQQIHPNLDSHNDVKNQENEWTEATGRRRKPAPPPPPALLPTPTTVAKTLPAVYRIVVHSNEVDTTLKTASGLLADIPVRASKGEGRITFLFDKEEDHTKASRLLRGGLDSAKVQTYSGVKVTIFNVPVPEEFDDSQATEYVTEGLTRKNTHLFRNGDFKVVYQKRHVRKPELMNIRLRVSPELRDSMLHMGKVNFDLTRCRVENHAFFKQCHYCQKPGHSEEACPSKLKEDPRTCMYCAKDHATSSCTTMKQIETHQCSNCKATTHHAGYQGCPALLKHMEEVSKNRSRT